MPAPSARGAVKQSPCGRLDTGRHAKRPDLTVSGRPSPAGARYYRPSRFAGQSAELSTNTDIQIHLDKYRLWITVELEVLLLGNARQLRLTD